MALKKWERHSFYSLVAGDKGDQRGNLFISNKGQANLEDLEILFTSVDTVRQLYAGVLDEEKLQKVIDCYAAHENYTSKKGDLFAVGGAMAGGYKYRLQSNDIGVIILLKHKFHDADQKASHIKIELSPKLIQSLDPLELQHYMDRIAAYWLVKPEPVGCAVHLAADIQGWQPAPDFLDRFVCRSKRITTSSGISEFSVESGEIASVYGRGQSMLFGTARGLQCAIYNKTKEALARDKLDFWQHLWSKKGGAEPFSHAYNPDSEVWRIEVRFHQSVLREYAAGTLDKSGRYEFLNTSTGELVGTKSELNRFLDVVPHLTGLWRTATMSFRLDTTKGQLIDPAWQKINEDCLYFDTENTTDYKRIKKTPAQGNEKNLALALGNMLSIYARQRYTINYVLHCLEKCGFWQEICIYYRTRGVGLGDLKELIKQKLIERRLLGKAS